MELHLRNSDKNVGNNEEELCSSTVHDLCVVETHKKKKKRGKHVTNCVLVGGDDLSLADVHRNLGELHSFDAGQKAAYELVKECNAYHNSLAEDCDDECIMTFSEDCDGNRNDGSLPLSGNGYIVPKFDCRRPDNSLLNTASDSESGSLPVNFKSAYHEETTSLPQNGKSTNRCDSEHAHQTPSHDGIELSAICPVIVQEAGDNCSDTTSLIKSDIPGRKLSKHSFEEAQFEAEDQDLDKPHGIVSSHSVGLATHLPTENENNFVIEVKKKSKSNKKSKKKSSKTSDEEEIEKILAELETGKKMPVKREVKTVPKALEPLPSEDSSKISCEKAKKKKKKKTVIESVPQRTTASVDHSSIEMDCNQFVCEGHFDKEHKSPLFSANDPNAQCDPSFEGHVGKDTKIDDGIKNRKRPGKKHLALIHEALKKAEEEKGRIQLEELARQKRTEEAERVRLEKLRLEEEKKEMKKKKMKDKKQRLKAEGKLLTKSQKLAKARSEAALSAWREHGIEVPQVGEKKLSSAKIIPRKASTRTEDDEGFPPSLLSESNSLLKVSSSLSSNETDDLVSLSWELLETEGISQYPDAACSPKQRHFSASSATNAGSVRPVNSITSSRQPKWESQKDRSRTKSESDLLHSTNGEEKAWEKIPNKKLHNEAKNESFVSDLRSPVVCVLGHVDTGKTKILDRIRKTHVQDSEAGGITQQIGATMVPRKAVQDKCHMVKGFSDFELRLPGLLIIDTPGHESFSNLRFRGSSLCDIAILVVDVMHGIEQQTRESIELLKQKKTPFVVALNKVDRLYGWKSAEHEDIQDVIGKQTVSTLHELDRRCKEIIVEFAKESLNVALYYENTDPRSYISLVPVSAVTGDGMGNLLAIVSQLCQTMMSKRLTFSDEVQASVLEVKTHAGLGTTIDVILVNGFLKEGDTIVLAGQDGPLVTQIRSMLMPQPLKELRVKNPYTEYKSIKGAQGVKVAGKDLDKAIAGLPLFASQCPDDIQILKEKMTRLYRGAMNSIKLAERGVYVQACTLGSLEALLDFLKSSQVPYAGVKVGPVVKKDVTRASVMLEHDVQYAVILAFDVKIERDAQELADNLGVRIFQEDIIYHLFDKFVEYRDELREKKKNEMKKFVVFPCKLNILAEHVFTCRDPIVLGVQVIAGALKVGTPLCVPSRNFLNLGVVSFIEANNQSLQCVKEGDSACIKIEHCGSDSSKAFGRDFDFKDALVSKISRESIDVCNQFYRDDLQKSDWQLMAELEKLFSIM